MSLRRQTYRATAMARHIAARAGDLLPGQRRLVEIGGRRIIVFNIKGELFALSDTCPHRGASLSGGVLTGLVVSNGPGDYTYTRAGEIIRCPWHQWEFDVRTGRSHCDPKRLRLMQFPACVEPGAALASQPLAADTYPVEVDADYIVITTPD
jgi:nitrite reductase/ring-hydroxylating ferredoxin subunit